MSALSQIRNQTSFDLLRFRRNPAAAFFTVILPIIFLVLFTSIFGNETLDSGAKVATLYVPGILSLSIVGATMVNLAITTTTRRERGMLKRLRGTPLRPWVFLLSQVLMAMVLATMMTVLITVIGRILFGVSLQFSALPTLIISLIIGAASFCALGLALSTIIPSEDAAPAITNAIALPLYFISDIFIINEDSPGLIRTIGNIFPVRHLVQAVQPAYDPFVDGAPLPWGHWAVILLWGAVGVVVTMTRFRWTKS